MITKDQIKSGIEIIKTIADTIKELKKVPSGHLYSQVMSFLGLSQYEQIISILKKSNIIREENHELIWNLQ